MQVFRGMDIGTAKPTAAERRRVPHHTLDLADPDEPFDVRQWLEAARAAWNGVRERGRRAVMVGGTGFYLRAWLYGLDPLPTSDPTLRRELEATPLEVLLKELAEHAPEVMGRIDQSNPRRVVRAVEIVRLGGRLPEPERSALGDGAAGRVVALRRQPDDLRRRIDTRVEAMFEAGLVAETRNLLDAGRTMHRTALQAIGYRQVVEHLNGARGLAETIALIKTRTWQFARRQMTWLRHQLPVTWLDVSADEPAKAIAERLAPGPGRDWGP